MNERKNRKSAFTLLEIMIALAIMSVLLAIILIPLRLAFDSLHVGQARNDVQTSLQSSLTGIETDLRQAVYVFPNVATPGLTDQAPYSSGSAITPPYTRSITATDTGSNAKTLCDGSSATAQWSNPARVDMILAARDTSGNIQQPLQASTTLVTYYPRRLNMSVAYDPIDNPMVLYRAETPIAAATANITSTRASSSCSSSAPSSGFLWLTHNIYGEADLSTIDNEKQTIATPRGLCLVASRAFRAGSGGGFQTPTAATINEEAPFKPDSSFTCVDTNGDGKIDRVTISLDLVSFDISGNNTLRNGQPSGQALRAERTVVLPNIQ